MSAISDMSNKSNRRGRKKLKCEEDVHKVHNSGKNSINSNEILGVDNSVDDVKEE